MADTPQPSTVGKSFEDALLDLKRKKALRRKTSKSVDQSKAELRALASYRYPNYEDLCRRYESTLAMCSSTQALSELFSIDRLALSLPTDEDPMLQKEEDTSDDEFPMCVSDTTTAPRNFKKRKYDEWKGKITEEAYKQMLTEYKKERKFRKIHKKKKPRWKSEFFEKTSCPEDVHLNRLKRKMRRRHRPVKIDSSKFLFSSTEDVDNYIDGEPEYFTYGDSKSNFYEDEAHFVEWEESRNKRIKKSAWTPDRENFNTIWMVVVKRDIPRAHRQYVSSHSAIINNCKRMSALCQKAVFKKVLLTLRHGRDTHSQRARRLAKEVINHWRKYDKEERDAKKKRQQEDRKRRKEEEEIREAKRQERKLDFLLTQTELYSHFIGRKMGLDGEAMTMQVPSPVKPAQVHEQDLKANANRVIRGRPPRPSVPVKTKETEEMDHVKQVAQSAVDRQNQQISAFDADVKRMQQESHVLNLAEGVEQVPSSDTVPCEISPQLQDTQEPQVQVVGQERDLPIVPTPKIFRGRLKQYQRKGLSWVVNLYEQGINGILADEMGLGKTVQSIAFLSYLAEVKGIWGPFIVLAPTSTLHNWQQEVAKFCPDLKVLPYWGSQNERKVIRKYWNARHLYSKNSPFHVLITNYNLVVRDEKYFHSIKWAYMILDEAQAIKSSSSARWKTLLSFSCRNRLLLTGTPIQNSMAELWALLHFIMPTLFDSHEEFTEWFSKGIESHAENKSALNKHQLERLHMILKPFMLRRLKRDVESEMPKKVEIEVLCGMSMRQRALYQGIREKISVNELLKNSFKKNNQQVDLMNLVMQFRKVCNHPELFERTEYRSPFLMELNPDQRNHSPLSLRFPLLIYNDLPGLQASHIPSKPRIASGTFLNTVRENLYIFDRNYVHQSLFDPKSNTFSFLRFLGMSCSELQWVAEASMLERWMLARASTSRQTLRLYHYFDEARQYPTAPIHTTHRFVISPVFLPCSSPNLFCCPTLKGLCFDSPEERLKQMLPTLKVCHLFIPKALASPVEVFVKCKTFLNQQKHMMFDPWVKKLFLGFEGHEWSKVKDLELPSSFIHNNRPYEDIYGMSKPLLSCFGSSHLWVPDFGQLIADSGKLRILDSLLYKLKKDGHRVLCYSQMTKVIDILEDYLTYRHHRYIRLDGSSKLSERRDMVEDFQTEEDIFVFLLSTRAGGLGINLTSADTVIFYDSDWNPTNDAQAMDRAHRIGQTKTVTVYRLITKGTIEDRIVSRAREKNKIHSLVIAGGAFDSDSKLNSREMVSLLLDDPKDTTPQRQPSVSSPKPKGGKQTATPQQMQTK